MGFRLARMLLLASIALLSTTAAQGAVMITVGNATFLPGETTKSVDVLIRSDGSDLLQAYAIRLQLDTTGVGNLLQFANPPSNAEWLAPNYVFFNDSAAQTPPPTFATVSTSVTANDTIDSGDFTLSGNDIALTTSDLLLARVDVTLASLAGGEFQINFDATRSSFFNSAGDELSVGAAIPEPVSLILWAGALAILVTTCGDFRKLFGAGILCGAR